jgi:anti-sigma factor ChrR (cupin superfamily)
MQLNTDLSQRVVLHAENLPWVSSPASGIDRRMLERDGAEQGRATSIVRYAPGSSFEPHAHPRGEEILVIEGEFQDEHGVYPKGSYIKNPPGSSHAPASPKGCTLLVKLYHLPLEDSQRIVIRDADQTWYAGAVKGLQVMPLSESNSTHTAFVRWAPGTMFNRHQHMGGEEIWVVEGTFEDEHGQYPQATWIRSPHMSTHQPFSREGCLIMVKVGHLHS